ncbi:hypothetical protein GLYMA_08G025000v4 [Glycine max]|nr:hypothetical protein GLYMA_08G025000v4 [Glycine max]KAG4398358.1 hypothetical protein GLYMA_08G025000v4 [Glycine max]KAH1049298.1 hypothetical protein GYH30_020028 [Glycine max]KAH1049299.1 hypothetical protein GYH30_020028 [Glycine max]
MGDSKRWTVTYTKHIKQKRKVYQDGFLELHVSTSKVKLYDECEKLLECRLLKNDEIVTSGETLIFNGYLVDIGDPEGGNKPESDLNVDRKLKNYSRFRTPSDGAKNTKMNEKENVGQVRRPLSPSQKVIRVVKFSEFKKRELLKYGSPKISQETPKTSTEEWFVLYTTQVTQKAKKYHDGFLRLVLRGSSGVQVMLFDTSRKLLDSRFLKKDDVIKSGESIAFDSYLIDIGEQQGSCTPDSNVLADKCTNVKAMKMGRQKTSLKTDTHVNVGKEWQVLYTTRLTKNTKKYHDGFLHIELCGSFGKQVVLYDLSKRPLERRFLRKDEVIREGESVYFDGHLVEVGEHEGSHHSPVKLNERGTGNNVVERRQLGHGQNGFHNVCPSFAKGKPPSELCPGQDSGLNSLITELEEIKSNRITPPIKPLRDANQILSILQNPNLKPQKSYVTGDRSPNGSHQNIGDRESAATAKSLDIKSSGACSGGSFQFTENVNMSHQSHSQKDAPTNTSETDCDCQPSLTLFGEEFSCESETFGSFDLGF